MYVDVQDDTNLKRITHHADEFVNLDEWPEIEALYGVKLETVLDDNTSSNDEPLLAVTLIRNRSAENEQWAENIGIKLRPFESELTVGEILRERIREGLASKKGWELVKQASCDFNWGDFIMNLSEFEPCGIIEKPANPCRSETLSVNTDELLAENVTIPGTVSLYNKQDVEICVFNANAHISDGTIVLENENDEAILDAWLKTGDIQTAKFVTPSETFDLEKDEDYRKLV